MVAVGLASARKLLTLLIEEEVFSSTSQLHLLTTCSRSILK